MPRSSEEISNYNSGSSGRTDANLANDSNHLGGIPADEYATQEYVQRYHDTKEAAQKEYLDTQDTKNLNNAKAYTDLMIQNQDFSGFAQKTDVLALQQDTANKLAQCQTTCANNLENTRQQIVSDVNAGFDDVGQSISQLNANQQQLFTSVSNGKTKVAAAITGQGVPTASDATFDTMASNIRQIETGGGELDPNFVNTSDATVQSSDILNGKTAYARGQKLYGTHICPENDPDRFDITDATATPYDILLGKTAYSNGGKIEGLLTIDTSTGQPSYSAGDVRKIYGTSKDFLKADRFVLEDELYPYRNNSIYFKGRLCFGYYSRNNWQGIRLIACANSDGNLSLASTYQGRVEVNSLGVKKIRTYSLTDINLKTPDNENAQSGNILEIAVSDLSIEYPFLVILTSRSQDVGSRSTEYNVKANIYPISYDNEYYSLDVTNKVEVIVPCDYTAASSVKAYYTITQTNIAISDDGTKIAFITTGGTYYQGRSYIYEVSPATRALTYIGYGAGYYSVGYYSYFYNNLLIVKSSNLYINFIDGNIYTASLYAGGVSKNLEYTWIGESESDHIVSYYLYSLTIDYENHTLQKQKISQTPINSGAYLRLTMWPVGEHNFLMKKATSTGQNSTIESTVYCRLEDDGTLTELQTVTLDDVTYHLTDTYSKIVNNGNSVVQVTNYNDTDKKITINELSTKLDYSEIVALEYNGDYYYHYKSKVLSAGQGDVRSGKTFIGWMGYPETGTMEVES